MKCNLRLKGAFLHGYYTLLTILQISAQKGTFLMAVDSFYWKGNDFCKYFRGHTNSGNTFLDIWEDMIGIDTEGNFCRVEDEVMQQIPAKRSQAPTPTMAKVTKKAKECELIDSVIEQKKYGNANTVY